jgi:hypothetical protein
MNLAAFWRGAGLALLLSTAGAFAFKVFAPLVGAGTGLKLLVLALGLAYLLLLLARHRVRIGRLASMAAWAGCAALLFALDPLPWVWLLAQTALVWLLRCLYAHDSLRAAALDAALNGLALSAALATAMHTGSLFLSLWCFFLVQALYVLIPATRPVNPEPSADSSFDQAERTARAALRRLATQPRQEYPS